MIPKPMKMYPNLDQLHKERKGLKGWLHKLNPLPLHVYHPLKFELYQAKIRLLSRYAHKKYQGQEEIMLNIGPGPNAKEGWVNLDITAREGVNCVFDCRKKLPFEDNSVKAIFMEHVFEHFDYTEEVPLFVSECYRVIEPGGIIRIIVPDLGAYLKAYCQDDWDSLKQMRPLSDDLEDHYFKCKYRTKMELVNIVFRQGFEHKYGYDFETLSMILMRYGFDDVLHQSYGKTLLAELNLDQKIRSTESLYVEGIK